MSHLLVVFLRCRQSLIEIPQEIVEALQSDGNADHIRADAGHNLLLIGQLLVRCAARVNHQAFGVSDIGEMRVNSTASIKRRPAARPPLMPKVYRPGAFGEVLARS